MIVDTIVLGDFQTNCYFVRLDEQSKDCLIVDPGMEAEVLVQQIKQNSCTPTHILLTHGHADHIGGVETLRAHWPGIHVAIHKDDADMLTDPVQNLSVMAGAMVQARPAEMLLDSDTTDYEAAGMRFSIIHTPGHTPGGISLYSGKETVLFSGDTLFCGSVGRSDFPGGNHEQLIEMIRTKLFPLPDETTVYSGHGPVTTIGDEKQSNPFL